MEDNFRNALIILSGIVIGAIFVHGLWTIRKQKNPYKLKTSKEKIEPIDRSFDGSGFDQDGVGQVKVLKTDPENAPTKEQSEKRVDLARNQNVSQAIAEESPSDTELDARQEPILSDSQLKSLNEESVGVQENEQPENQSHDSLASDDLFAQEAFEKPYDNNELGDDITQIEKTAEPVYQEPVTHAKPEIKLKKPARKAPAKSATKAALKRNQMEINFDDELATGDEMPSFSATDSAAAPETLEPQVIILSVVMPQGQQMFGAALLPSLLTLGMKYGEMNIFHRHQDNAGNGAVTFSLANMLNPGSFDLDSMETFATQGVSLFMTLPNAGDPFNVFEQMLAAAKQLAQEFNAQLLDDKRNVMTKQTEQHYMSKIREFDRKSRIAFAE
ncbi:cell division protein ZipA [Litorilituus lipolyticus]|uniref:Cell division protein ZipA n=1 Tax=Litorilituus lipolyticus TaxID=2491017 RepID=A0A502KW21_9GAMM|nr:cell division protein ZipA [Litorilituus lipolyticus]TPH14639.1 cell division protein ZipA [Litorilituus lipolyticus]